MIECRNHAFGNIAPQPVQRTRNGFLFLSKAIATGAGVWTEKQARQGARPLCRQHCGMAKERDPDNARCSHAAAESLN